WSKVTTYPWLSIPGSSPTLVHKHPLYSRTASVSPHRNHFAASSRFL
ncbi:MAG: hypothetical protein AVDCRST_MAG86-2696, partial [uncultured Truepera sp.]